MKTIFVINPCAGRENSVKLLLDKVKNLTESECEVYITKSVGDELNSLKIIARTTDRQDSLLAAVTEHFLKFLMGQ